MKVSNTQPYQIIYTILEHEFLGYLLETFAIQVNSNGKLTLQHQNVWGKNAKEFDAGLDQIDYKLISLIDSIQPDAIYQKFGDKKQKPNEFILKTFDKLKPNIELKEYILNYLEKQKILILSLLKDKKIFEMGNDGEPTWREIIFENEKATILFHFYRNEHNTHYLPTIKHENKKVEFQYKNAKLICNNPAWLLCQGHLYQFEKNVEGSKLKPFLNKKFIEVPRKMEEEFFKKFGTQLIASFDVYAKGFDIHIEESKPKAILTFSELHNINSTPSLFAEDVQNEEPSDVKIVFELNFMYGDEPFRADYQNPTLVRQEKTDLGFNFYKIKRDFEWEKSKINFLKSIGFDLQNAKKTMTRSNSFSWIAENRNNIENEEIILRQNQKDNKKYFTGISNLNIEIKENIDWFDINTIVVFGEFTLPFRYLKNLILKKQNEFTLPNGEIAVIPDSWFTKYSELFAFIDDSSNDEVKLQKHHIALVQDLSEDSHAVVKMQNKLLNLKNFIQIDEVPLPSGFKGVLRPYQQAGYNWMHFLKKYKFGGCLADDMGLGKTIQTLAYLLSQKNIDANQKNTSLLIVPTSLVYNWEIEAKKFTPDLKIHTYTGSNRNKSVAKFANYDLIITTYGLVRVDESIFKNFYFHYIILDEAQAIKNPNSIISISVRNLGARFRLILTGTPIENSTLDLWSQMTFANPGLLGSFAYFRDEFQKPIEKDGNLLKTKKLYAIIKPFILRRLKSQVASDLPEKIESVRFTSMTTEQEKIYEETKSYFRNKILDNSAKDTLILLQGLTKLRQIANHPHLIDENYIGDSGKMEDVLYLIEEALESGRKILIFSQFVKHLNLLRKKLDLQNKQYCYIDGSSTDRQIQVEEFQSNENTKLFLISLKAGGVGLNLTAADCVFILDPWWNPAIEAQAIDRAHRIGQKKTVFTYKFITKTQLKKK